MGSILDRAKPKNIKLVFAASPLRMQHQGEITKTGLLGIRIFFLRGATCLPRGLLFQWASTLKIQLRLLVKHRADLIIISLKIYLFSPWYSWKIAELTLNSNHSHTRWSNILPGQVLLQETQFLYTLIFVEHWVSCNSVCSW